MYIYISIYTFCFTNKESDTLGYTIYGGIQGPIIRTLNI